MSLDKSQSNMTITSVKEHVYPDIFDQVQVKEMGDLVELKYFTDKMGGIITKINANEYINNITGERKLFQHTQKRTDTFSSIASIKRSLQRIKETISTNVRQDNMKNCLWVTLTYRNAEEGMLSKECYNHFKLYNMRFQHFLVKNNFPKAEYICVIEPQGRAIKGRCVWHFHVIYIFPSKAPFIDNADIERLWGYGFTKTKAIKNIDNFGQYLGRIPFKCSNRRF